MSELARRSASTLRALYAQAEHIVHEMAKFGVVGVIAFVVDIGLFNLLRGLTGSGPLADKPLTAKVISVVVATTVAYFGNRFWTFRHRARTSMRREYVLFFVLNGVGLLISVGPRGSPTTHSEASTSLLADNISANFVGVAIGTMFRFWSYRKWVFLPNDQDAREPAPGSQLADHVRTLGRAALSHRPRVERQDLPATR